MIKCFMSPQSQAARTLSLIMEALKVSSHASSSLTQIVKVIRGHFKVELCSLYELNQGQLKLVATDAVDFGAVGHVLPATHLKLLELATRKMETAFLEDRRSSCIAVPLIHREEISGLLVLQSARPQPLQPEEARFLEFIALQLAGTLPAIAALERAKRQVRVKPDQVVFKGIPASPGFGIGPALLLRAGGLSTPIAQGSY
ncbi:GAF domain-containing protein, partial [bacterium]